MYRRRISVVFAAVFAALSLAAATVPPECAATKGAKIENGVVRNGVDRNAYCMIEYKLKEKVPFSPAQTLAFEYRLTADDPKAFVVVSLLIDGKATYATQKANGEWQTAKLPLSGIRYEMKFGGTHPEKGGMIGGLKIYGRAPVPTKMILELKNIEFTDTPAAAKAPAAETSSAPAPVPADKAKLAGKQIELCMIGDSITWAGVGDYFRGYLLPHIPELAFVGTHTAKLGYSHAGEGNDNTVNCLKNRVEDPVHIPNSRYYHLLMGVNDASGAVTLVDRAKDTAPEKVIGDLARKIADRLMAICGKLLARPTTEKVFLGTIFPCYPGWLNPPPADMIRKYEFRDWTTREVNKILRAEVPAKFNGKVVLVEYEFPLRARPDWKKEIMLHPTAYGYAVVAQILAETLKKEARPANGPAGNYGVEVVNLWDDAKQQTLPLIPGHYVMSFETDDAPDGKAVFELYGDHPSHPVTKRKAFVKKLTVTVTPGKRAFAVVPVTSPESVGRETCRIRNANCTLKKIKIEKMRPDGRPTPYQTGRVIDTTVTPYLGELLVQVP